MQLISVPSDSPESKNSSSYVSQKNASGVQWLSFRNRHFSKSNQSPPNEKSGTKKVRKYLATLSWNRIQHINHEISVSPEDEKTLLQNENIWCLLDSKTVSPKEYLASGGIKNVFSPMRAGKCFINDEIYTNRRDFPSSEYSEWGGDIFEHEGESQRNFTDMQFSFNTENSYEPIISDETSYNDHEGLFNSEVTIYKTKSRFNGTLQRHFNRFQKKFQHIYENYQKKKSSKSNFNPKHNLDNNGTCCDSTNFDHLPPDALTCYNQFRTQNLSEFFEKFPQGCGSDDTNNIATTNNNIPECLYSINELSYEKLKDYRNQILSVSPLISTSNLELDVFEELQKKKKEESPTDICDINDDEPLEPLTEKSSPRIEIFDPEELEIFEESEEQKRFNVESELDEDEGYDHIDDGIPLAIHSNKSTPNIVSQLFHSTEEKEEPKEMLYPLDNSNDGDIRAETFVAEPNHTEEEILFMTGFHHDVSNHYGSPDPQLKNNALSAETFSSFEPEPLTPRSVLKRVRSVFGRNGSVLSAYSQSNIGVGSRSSSDNSSNYTPVSVVVPALKPNTGFLHNLAGRIFEGFPVSAIYHDTNPISGDFDKQEQILCTKNPKRFFSNSSVSTYHSDASSALKRSRTSSIDLMTTIKFDKFASLLLYDGSKRLKYITDNATIGFKSQGISLSQMGNSKMRQNMFKNNGTLVLGSTGANDSMNRLSNIRLSRFSKFAQDSSFTSLGEKKEHMLEDLFEEDNENETQDEFGGQNGNYEGYYSGLEDCEEEDEQANLTRDSVKSILKTRNNRNQDAETVRALYCDDVEVDDFIAFLENHERKKQENEPYLERIRERQLLTYYADFENDGEGLESSSDGSTFSGSE